VLYLLGVAFVAPFALVVLPLAALLALLKPGRREALAAAAMIALTLWGWGGSEGLGAADAFQRFGAAWVLLVAGSLVLTVGRNAALTQRPVAAGLAAVTLAAAVGTLLIGVTSFSFGELQFLALRHFTGQARTLIGALAVATQNAGEGTRAAVAAFETSSLAMAELVSRYLPGLVLLQTLAALALAWSFYRAIAREPEGAPLPSLREFRFNDHLIWGVVAALLTLVLPRLSALEAVGGNLAAFFAGLYLLRGLGVLVALFAGASGVFAVIFGAVVLLFLLPLALLVALAVGVTDTWVDWRTRAAKAKAP
jgi:hypothetical protein